MNFPEPFDNLKDLLKEITSVADYLWQRGWAERNAGNISVDVTKLIGYKSLDEKSDTFHRLHASYPALADKTFLVSVSGSRMRDLARDPLQHMLILRINGTGDSYRIFSSGNEMQARFVPTSELPTHLGIHQMLATEGRKESVVLHAHVTELIALTQIKEYCDEEKLNHLFWNMHPENGMFIPKGVGFVPYTTPGTKDIAEKTLAALENHRVALWEKHGAFVISENPGEAFDTIDMLAKAAQIFFFVRNSGYDPQGLTDEQLDILKGLAEIPETDD